MLDQEGLHRGRVRNENVGPAWGNPEREGLTVTARTPVEQWDWTEQPGGRVGKAATGRPRRQNRAFVNQSLLVATPPVIVPGIESIGSWRR
jgi:hypothetical protein